MIKFHLPDKEVIFSFFPFVVLILLAAGLSYRYHSLLQEQRARVVHTYEVITRLEDTLINLLDAETGQRGFVITGEERYLQPYQEASIQAPRGLSELRHLVSDSSEQQQRLQELGDLVKTKFDELNESIGARRVGGFEAARVIVLRDSGRATMDGVRSIIGTMKWTELDLLAKRGAELHKTEHRLLATTIMCAALSLAARLGLHMLAWRHHRRRASGEPIGDATSK